VSIPKGGFPASYGMLDRGTLRVLTLDDGKVVAEVALTR
ncbi:MAG: YfcE family phosphodiesterase, partial [Serratia marcescens]|nr:YfcE family phosphodiesterase [Serratia marcescens]